MMSKRVSMAGAGGAFWPRSSGLSLTGSKSEKNYKYFIFFDNMATKRRLVSIIFLKKQSETFVFQPIKLSYLHRVGGKRSVRSDLSRDFPCEVKVKHNHCELPPYRACR